MIDDGMKSFYTILMYCICVLFAGSIFPQVSGAFSSMEGENGNLLILEKEEAKAIHLNPNRSGDPFNWSPEIMRDYYDTFLPEGEDGVLDFHLSGIIWDAYEPMAVIEEQLLGEGDVIEGVQVVQINRNSVFLRKGAERYTLHFKEFLFE